MVSELLGNIKDMFLKTRLQEMGGLSSGWSLIRGTSHTEASFVHLHVYSHSDHDARVSVFKDTKCLFLKTQQNHFLHIFLAYWEIYF